MVIERIIEDLFEEIDFDAYRSCKYLDPVPMDCVACCRDGFFSDDSPDYSCGNKRLIYSVRYAPVHVGEVKSCLRLVPTDRIAGVLNKRSLRVLSIGGGPGTDLVAVTQWVSENVSNIEKIEYFNVDKVSGWSEVSEELSMACNESEVKVIIKNRIFDVTGPAGVQFDGKFDIVVVSYLLSELGDKESQELAQSLTSVLNSGAMLVINDRNESVVKERIDRFFSHFSGVRGSDDSVRHSGFQYRQDIWDKASPKIHLKSIRYCKIVG